MFLVQTLGHYELGGVEVAGLLGGFGVPADVLLTLGVLVLGEAQVT